MNTAFSAAYPPERSVVARALLPLVQPRAYLRAIHLLLMFPLGIGYFVFFVTAFAFGGALIWTFVGPPVLLLALFISLYIGDVEAWMVRVAAGEDIRRPPKVMEGVTSLRDKVWTRVIDPSTWTGVFYEVAQFPIGVAGFVVVVVGFSVSAALIGAPLLVELDDEPLHLADDFVLDSWWEGLPFVPLGVLAWIVTMHVVTVFSTLHALWARALLGSRARHQRGSSEPGPASPVEPDPTPGTPIGLLAAPEPAVLIEAPVANPPEGQSAPWDEGFAQGVGPGEHPALKDLTAREREVFLLAVRGYSNADICEACYISEGTVKTHIRHILAKLDLLDRTQLIVFAYEQGIVQPGRRPVAMSIAR